MGRGANQSFDEVERGNVGIDDLVEAEQRGFERRQQRLEEELGRFLGSAALSRFGEEPPSEWLQLLFDNRTILLADPSLSEQALRLAITDGFGDPATEEIGAFVGVQRCRMLATPSVGKVAKPTDRRLLKLAVEAAREVLSSSQADTPADLYRELLNAVEDAVTLDVALDCAKKLLALPRRERLLRLVDHSLALQLLEEIDIQEWPDQANLAAALAGAAIRRDRFEVRQLDRREIVAHLLAQFWPETARSWIASDLSIGTTDVKVWKQHYPHLFDAS